MAKNTIHNELAELEPGDIRLMVDNLMQLNSLGKCKNNEEVRDRIQLFFDFCRDKAFRPGVESLATALCIHRNTLFQWSKGKNCDPERTEIINNALQIIHAFLEQSGLSGKLSPPSYIFLCKAWLGYRETSPVSDFKQEKDIDTVIPVDDLAKRLGLQDVDFNNDFV